MNIDFMNLVQLSGDSNLLAVSSLDNMLCLKISAGENMEEYELNVPVQLLEINFKRSQKDSLKATFHIECINPNERLRIENGFYVPSSDFGNLMKEKRLSLSLFYGLKSMDSYRLVLLKGYENLLAFVCEDINLINIKIIR